ncbi:MAG TPA: hypothetical protein PLZ70_01020 [Candidatus Paceibacterota bacterium]|jgi:hypothetical protein|nr:hypothetical protein [Candidatus Paceibacterota bacterium]HQO70851.1 hypothetical protein [Candidatus Paceibacterota bacterium]HQQ21981.1 hypothetical protein [Candidatus Paceibacterota bacterium]
MSPLSYKGYRVGSIEKEILKIFLNVKSGELPNKYNEKFSDILKTAQQKSNYSKMTKNMARKGFLVFKNKGGEIKIEITDSGRKIASNYYLCGLKTNKNPKVWDKKWRIVMFDIPEKKKKARDLIRFHLKRLGFLQIQVSAWIFPYPCEELVTIIKSEFGFDKEVVYLIASRFEGDYIFRKSFKV